MATHNHQISLQKAIELTKRFRDEKENLLADELSGQDVLPHSETFERAAFDGLLKNAACTYIRAYFGLDADKKIRLIFVAANANNEDILPSSTAASLAASPSPEGNSDDDDDDGGPVEEGQRCPPVCPPPSPLNQP